MKTLRIFSWIVSCCKLTLENIPEGKRKVSAGHLATLPVLTWQANINMPKAPSLVVIAQNSIIAKFPY
jgi:hypothetical protein